MVIQLEVIWVPAVVNATPEKGSQLVFDYFNESHPCYSEAKASKIKEWTDQHFELLSLTPE